MILSQDADAHRKNSFSFLRFALATLVVFSHSFPILQGSNVHEPLPPITHGHMIGGMLALTGFFLVSGFLVTRSWTYSQGIRDYLCKRFLRIYPGWIVALLVCLIIVAPLARGQWRWHLGDPETYGFLAQLTFHHVGIGQATSDVFTGLPEPGLLDGPTWTIPFELLCYSLLAALGLAGAVRARWPVLVLLAVALAYVGWPGQEFHDGFGPGLSWNCLGISELTTLSLFIAYFFCGASFFLFWDRVPHSPLLLSVAVLILLATLRSPLSPLLFVALPVCGGYTLLRAAFSRRVRLHGWGQHGDLSYGVYLYAWPRSAVAGHVRVPAAAPGGSFRPVGPFRPLYGAAAVAGVGELAPGEENIR